MSRNLASFRDPSGYIFTKDGEVYRQITPAGIDQYKSFMSSGLYETLVKKNYLLEHKELPSSLAGEGLTIHPKQVDFISYPYEWSFAQLKDAALLTLYIQMEALRAGQSLKDASAYNVQFLNGRPVFIDTLSLEPLEVGKPWVAYKQFCQHFLAPLALAAYVDIRCIKFFQTHIDGVPLDMASAMLPIRTKVRLGLLTHIHWHARTQSRYANRQSNEKKGRKVSRMAMMGLIDNLTGIVKKLQWNPKGTEWGDYYNFTNYDQEAFRHKKEIVSAWLDKVKPQSVWDLGANDGTFSRLASDRGIPTKAFDIDPIAVEKNYRNMRKQKEQHILPLLMDLTNPSPAIGWGHVERDSLQQRADVDLVMSLALVHHLAISNNVPLSNVANYLSSIGKYLIIEFVPRGDSQVDILLATRKDIFPQYNEEGFETSFLSSFFLEDKIPVRGSKRTMYLLKTK